MRCPFIHDHREEFSILIMCQVMNVSTSGYYAWRSRPESLRSRENRQLTAQIRMIHAESRQTYGSPRVPAELHARGVLCSRGRVERLMRSHGIRAKQTKRSRATTDSRHSLPVAENVLGRDFETANANRKWAADITYHLDTRRLAHVQESLHNGRGSRLVLAPHNAEISARAGRCNLPWHVAWSLVHLRWPSNSATSMAARCFTTATGAASTPRQITRRCCLLTASNAA